MVLFAARWNLYASGSVQHANKPDIKMVIKIDIDIVKILTSYCSLIDTDDIGSAGTIVCWQPVQDNYNNNPKNKNK